MAEVELGNIMSYDGDKAFEADADKTGAAEYTLCQYGDEVFFVVAENSEEENVYVWSLFSETLQDGEQKQIYTGSFCRKSGEVRFADLTAELYAQIPQLSSGGMYYNGKIYLFDASKVMEYDITLGNVLEAAREQYVFPQTELWVELGYNKLRYGQRAGEEEKSISLYTMAETNEYAEQLRRDRAVPYWNSFLVSEDAVYISMLLSNSAGYDYALVFEHKWDGTVKFVSKNMCISEAGDHHLIPVVAADRSK